MSTREEREQNIARVHEERERNIARARGEEYTGSSTSTQSSGTFKDSRGQSWTRQDYLDKQSNKWNGIVNNDKGRGKVSPTRQAYLEEHGWRGVDLGAERRKEAEIADLNQKYKQAYIDYNKARRAVEAAGKGRGTADYTTAKNKMDEADALVEAYKKRVEEAGGTLWTPTDWWDTVKWSTRAGLTSADNAIAKGLDWAFGGFADELRTLAGVTVNDISPSLADDAAGLVTKAGRVINPNYTYGDDNFLRQYIEEGNRRINLQHEEAARAASDSKAAQTVGKYTEMVMNSLPMSMMALLSGGTSTAAQATTEALQAASTLANSSRAAQIVTPILKATADMAADPNWGFTFMSVVGDSYENALEDGASEEQASLYAILNAAYNATTEIGGTDDMWGGLQKLPKNIRAALERADNSALMQIVKGIPSEMSEEIIQGIGESGLKSVYKDVPLYSTTDEGAMINPNRMKEEAIGAAVVSAVLGGGQTAATAGAYAIENGRAQRRYRDSVAEVHGGPAADRVESGIESAQTPRRRTPVQEEAQTQEAQGTQYPQGTQEETPEWARQTPQELYRDIEKNEPEFFRDMVELKGMRPDVPRGRFDGRTGQQIEEDPAEWKRYDARRKELEEKYGADRVWAIDAVLEDGTLPVQQTAQQVQQATERPQGTQNTRRPDGILEAAYRGEVGQIKAIVQDGGKFTARVQMPDGRTRDVTEDKLTFDAETQRMLDSVRPYAYGDEMLLSYRPEDNGGDFDTYVRAYTTAADMYGKQTAVTAQQAYESSRRNGGAGSVLTQEQFTKAFNTGRSSKDARIQNSAARQRGEGKVYFGQDVDYGGERYKAASEDMVSSTELDVIKTLAKITGTDVVFYQSEADMTGRYKGANGFMRNGTMYLDVNAGANRTSEESAVLLTAAHELTHYIRENNAEGYAQLRDFVTRHLIEDGADIEALAEQKAARENGLLSMDEAVEEVIADSCEMMLEDTQLPEIMAKENPGLYEQIREWIANFAEKLRKAFTGVEARHAEAKAMMKYADELQQIWDSALAGAVRNAETASGNETVSKNAKYSLREFEDGTKYVDVKTDQDAFNGLTQEEMTSKAREIIKSRFAGKVVGSSNRAFVNNASANEYAYPSRFIKDEQVKEAKMRAAPELDNLIEAGRNYRTAADGRDGHVHKNATGGFTYFDVTFKVGDEYFDGVINIENNKNGRRFKDITKIRNATEDIISSYGKTPKSKFLSDTSMVSISRGNENGNTKFSMRERDDAADVKTAEKYFGTTYKIAEAGYLLRDGKLLDMSGRHEGAPGGYRTVDHRDITDAFDGDYGDGSYSGGMVQFMQAGNIRLSPESGGINLSTKPNAKQLDVLDRYISSFRGEVTLDIDNANGDTVVSIEYPKRTYSKRIINDINEYFDNGTVPAQPSDLGQFRYSMRDVAADDTADERRGRQESYAELRRQNEELRRRAEYWKGQTRTTKEATVRKTDTDKLARRLTEELHNKDAEDTVKEELKRMGDYIVQTDGQELSYAELKDWAAAIADHILSGSEAEIESGMEDARRELLDYLKSNKLKINEREMQV